MYKVTPERAIATQQMILAVSLAKIIAPTAPAKKTKAIKKTKLSKDERKILARQKK